MKLVTQTAQPADPRAWMRLIHHPNSSDAASSVIVVLREGKLRHP